MSMDDQLLYDEVAVGDRYPTVRFEVSPLLLRSYGDLFDDEEYIQLAGSKRGTVLRDPSILILFGILRAVLRNMDRQPPPGGVLAKQFYQFLRPLHVGQALIVEPSIDDKYLKGEYRYVVLRCGINDEGGEAVGRITSHVIWAR